MLSLVDVNGTEMSEHVVRCTMMPRTFVMGKAHGSIDLMWLMSLSLREQRYYISVVMCTTLYLSF